MCFTIISYTDWICGYRQNTGTHQVACIRRTCRLSDVHSERNDGHDCNVEGCTGPTVEEQHLVMERRRDVCAECREHGRGPGQHPGALAARRAANGTNGAINYRHIAGPGDDVPDW
ncbi:hypothetical protein PYCCODRAFT_1433155 [Trametes coccinea BRFM310]|uniref:Uncharacterized protein n=1 Tax=Trametes coccinea (strain BRFM310) TaxID=1353009 RepID=A0A1Y2IUI4_TRAC3|nr:hypothetical protein PYCCODRAFT_1433155 [Trametes coccinea BRFM310]